MEPQTQVAESSFSPKPNAVLAGSFGWMALGLLLSFITSIAMALSPRLVNLILGSGLGFIALVIVQVVAVIYLRRRVMSMSVGAAKGLFVLYSVLSGLTLSVIFFAYDLSSIFSIFIGTAFMFGALALYGANTSKDLTSAGRMAGFALVGLLVALVFNLLIGARTYELVVSWIGVIIFAVFTAYDAQKLKNMSLAINSKENLRRAKIIGGLKLYLDFMNLFLSLLRIFGRRK